MKTKNLLLNVLTAVLSLVLIVPMFVDLFSYSIYGKITQSTTLTPFGFFAEYPGTIENTVGALILDICIIAGVVLAGLFVLALVLEFVGVKLNYEPIKKVLGILFLVAFVVALIGGILFVSQNVFDNDLYTRSLVPQFGFYLTLALLLASGVLSFVSASLPLKKVTKSRKRKK